MEKEITLKDDLLDSLGEMNTIIENLLVVFIHVLKSKNVTEDVKFDIKEKIVTLGREINNFYLGINIKSLTKYDIRETEKRIIEKNNEIRQMIKTLLSSIAKTCEIIVDKRMIFSITDVISQLSSIKIYNDYAITKDKIENMLAVKRFITGIYEDQLSNIHAIEKNLDKDFYKLKEKTFMQIIRNGNSNNPEYYFKSLELIKKLIATGKYIRIGSEKNNAQMDEIILFAHGEDTIEYQYSYNGITVKFTIIKRILENGNQYEITGMIGKGLSEVPYSINLKTIDTKVEQIERMIGIDFLWSYYEKTYIDLHTQKESSSAKNEELNKTIVGKAIDDILFN
jgi:hypothetical protein